MTVRIFQFTGETLHDLEPDVILEAAKGQLESAFVIGYTPDGDLYAASSDADMAHVIWMLQKFIHDCLHDED